MPDVLIRTKNATAQSESSKNHTARKAVDKDKQSTNYFESKKKKGSLPWFQIELNKESEVWKVLITNSLKCCDENRDAKTEVRVGNTKIPDEYIGNMTRNVSDFTSKNGLCGVLTVPTVKDWKNKGTKGERYLINCMKPNNTILKGKYVTLQSLDPDNVGLHFKEVEVYGKGNKKI